MPIWTFPFMLRGMLGVLTCDYDGGEVSMTDLVGLIQKSFL
jgi:hypothetical protein